jgi:hypothetical protein
MKGEAETRGPFQQLAIRQVRREEERLAGGTTGHLDADKAGRPTGGRGSAGPPVVMGGDGASDSTAPLAKMTIVLDMVTEAKAEA